MNDLTTQNAKTRERLIKHYTDYSNLQIEDLFKYIFQSAFGCEHLVSNYDLALNYIKREYDEVSKTSPPVIDRLDGLYSRVHLSCLNSGLSPETLTKLFCLSAKKEMDGSDSLQQKIQVVKDLIDNGILPLDRHNFDKMLNEWKSMGYPSVHHSAEFRRVYHPAYRVIANEYVEFLQVFAEIDKSLSNGSAIVAIDGGSASGKTTLASLLEKVYDCNVFHMDDFFLRPDQRTVERLSEVGGNADRERFDEEIIQPLKKNKTICYRRFDCSTQTLGEPIIALPKELTVIEGVYSMHPAFDQYYDLSVFLDIDAESQKNRILKRNSKAFAHRFFSEWIPLENEYFSMTRIYDRSDLSITVSKFD